METIRATKYTSISEFKNNPSAACKEAGIQGKFLEAINKLFFELQITPVIKKHHRRGQKSIPVDLLEL